MKEINTTPNQAKYVPAAKSPMSWTQRELAGNSRSNRKEPTMRTPLIAMVGTHALASFGRGRQSLRESVWYSGWLLTFLATGEDTQGRFALIEGVTRKGNVPPPHIHHREDETFYILEGEMTASVGGQAIHATPGTMIFAPRNVVHSFEIHSEQLRALVLLTPAGLEGYFKECSVPAPAMTLPPPAEVPYCNIEKMLAVGARYGIEGVSPQSTLVLEHGLGSRHR